MDEQEQEILILNQIRQRTDPLVKTSVKAIKSNGLIVTDTVAQELEKSLVKAMWGLFNKEGKTYAEAMEKLESLKEGKEPSIIENLRKQQEEMVNAFQEREKELAYNVIHKWEVTNFGVKE